MEVRIISNVSTDLLSRDVWVFEFGWHPPYIGDDMEFRLHRYFAQSRLSTKESWTADQTYTCYRWDDEISFSEMPLTKEVLQAARTKAARIMSDAIFKESV